MFNIRVRECSPAGDFKRVLPAENITFTTVDSGAPLLTFSVSERIAAALDAPFVAAVEYQTEPGARWKRPRQELLICSNGSGDELDPAGVVTYTGVGYVPWLLARMYVQGTRANGINDRTFPNATPGGIVKTIVTEAKGWGWAPHLTTDFTDTHDSNGVAWTTDDRSSIKWRVGTPIANVLQQLAEQGLVEWWAEGNLLRLFRAPGGIDRSAAVVLGGAGFSAAPRSASFDDVFTKVTIFYDDQKYVNVDNPGADMKFGSLWATMTQSGVTDPNVARKLAQPALIKGRANAEQLGFDWTPAPNMPIPFESFNIGDNVSVVTRGGVVPKRVLDLVITKSEGVVDVRATVGSRVTSQAVKQARRSSSAVIGTIIGGSGNGFSGGPVPSSPIPEFPTGVHVTSNVGEWLRDGSARSLVGIEWNAVDTAIDGGGISIRDYEIWSRTADGVPELTLRTTATEAVIRTWQPEVPRFFMVRARSAVGAYGEFSPELSVTPVMPTSIVPKPPTGLSASQTAFYSPGGAPKSRVVLSWDAVTQSTDDSPVEVVRYDVWERTGPGTSVFLSSTKTTSLTFEIPSDGDRWYRVQAFSDLGFGGDLSTELKVSPSVPPVDTTPPATPVLVPGMATVEAQWNGLMQSGAAPGAHIANVLAQTSATGSAPWKSVGAPLSRAGSVTVPGPKGVPVHVRFVTMDSLGRTGGVSAVVSAAPTGVGVPDIDAAIQDAIDQATADANNALATASTADGRVTVSPNAPVAGDGTGKALGSVWFRRSTGGMFIGVWEWTALGWVSRQLDNATIANLDAAKIDTGFLNAARIAANTINAQMISIGDFTNLASGSDFEDAEKIPWTLPAVFEVTSDYAYSGTKSLRVNGALSGTASLISGGIPVSAGDEFYVEFWMRRDAAWNGTSGNSKLRFGFNGGGLYGLSFALADAPVGVWTKRSGVAKIPNNGTTSMSVTIVATDATAGYAWIDDIVIRRRAAGNLLVDGAVGAREINTIELWANSAWIDAATIGVLRASVIETTMLSAGFAQNLNLEANGSITMIVGQLDQTASDVANAADAAAAAQNAANNAANAANSAGAVAGGAVAQSLEALNAAQAALDGLDDQQAVYQFTDSEAIVTTPGGEQALHLAPDRISLKKNGQTLTYWEGQQMVVQQVVADGISVGNHRAEANGTNRTTWRPL